MSFEGPKNHPKKVESVDVETPPDVSLKSITAEASENTFIGRNAALERVANNHKIESPGEFRKMVGGLLERMKGLRAVSGKEAATAAEPRTHIELDSIGTLNHQPRGKTLDEIGIFDVKTPAPKPFERPFIKGLHLNNFDEAQVNKELAEKNQPDLPTIKPELKRLLAFTEQMGVAKEKAALESAESEYLAKYKEFHAKNGALSRLGKSTIGHKESQDLEDLKKKYDASRVEYANVIASRKNEANETPSPAFRSRLEGKFAKFGTEGNLPIPKDKAGRELSFEEYLMTEHKKRNESVANYARFREVIRPAAEKKIIARTEALGEKGKNTFQKGLMWLGKKNQDLENKYGKTGAKIIKALAGTVILGTGAAAVGTFGSAPLLAVAGWGTLKFGKSLLGSMVGAAAGEIGADIYEKHFGKKDQDQAKKSLITGSGTPDNLTASKLAALDKEREILLGKADGSDLEKKKALIKILGAFVGVGASGAIQELSYFNHASHALAAIPTHAPGHPIPVHHEAPKVLPESHAHEHVSHHHHSNHHRFSHHPHASAGHEEAVHTGSSPEIDRDAQIKQIYEMEKADGGLASAADHEKLMHLEHGESVTNIIE